MSLTLVIVLILLGLILMLLEVLVIPGIGVAGIGGVLLVVIGVVGAYTITSTYGHVTLVSSLLASGIILYLSLQSRTWDRLSLKTEMQGKASSNATDHVKPGDKGETITRLNPSGKAKINGQVWEVSTYNEFLPQEFPVEVIQVEVNKIFVKPLNLEP